MKLLIIVTLLTIASSTSMQSFLTIETPSWCGSVLPANMCGCQSSGCAFEEDTATCSAIGANTGSTTFTAGILKNCGAASTKASCLSHVAWDNRFGGKVECAWCSTACVHSHNADETCNGSGLLDTFYTTTDTTTPEPEPVVPAGPSTKDIEDRVEANGGLSADKTLLGITLAWENCNDLDLELFDPQGGRIYWNNL